MVNRLLPLAGLLLAGCSETERGWTIGLGGVTLLGAGWAMAARSTRRPERRSYSGSPSDSTYWMSDGTSSHHHDAPCADGSDAASSDAGCSDGGGGDGGGGGGD